MNKIKFYKMHGLGNDFMVTDRINQSFELTGEKVRRWSDRYCGIGFDQLLVVDPSNKPDIDFIYRIYNADGSEVEQCGNGARCFADYVGRKGYSNKETISVETQGGVIYPTRLSNGLFRVDMGIPNLAPSSLPFKRDEQSKQYSIQVSNNEQLTIGAISMGNPHAVIEVEDIHSADVARLGRIIESHPDFPNRVNVGFMQRLDETTLLVRVYERGAGETQACGTGACAASVYAHLLGKTGSRVTVKLKGGDLTIDWQGEGKNLYLEGPSSFVYSGEISDS